MLNCNLPWCQINGVVGRKYSPWGHSSSHRQGLGHCLGTNDGSSWCTTTIERIFVPHTGLASFSNCPRGCINRHEERHKNENELLKVHAVQISNQVVGYASPGSKWDAKVCLGSRGAIMMSSGVIIVHDELDLEPQVNGGRLCRTRQI
jgi:hypothetical protein